MSVGVQGNTLKKNMEILDGHWLLFFWCISMHYIAVEFSSFKRNIGKLVDKRNA